MTDLQEHVELAAAEAKVSVYPRPLCSLARRRIIAARRTVDDGRRGHGIVPQDGFEVMDSRGPVATDRSDAQL